MINCLKNIVLAATNTNISGGPGSLIEAPISFAITMVLCQVSTTLVPTIALSSFQRALRQFHAVESMFHDYNCTMSELSSMLIVNTLYGFQVSELNHMSSEELCSACFKKGEIINMNLFGHFTIFLFFEQRSTIPRVLKCPGRPTESPLCLCSVLRLALSLRHNTN